jgi:CPA2 family monovalent cation:H+ antiporter-2
MPHATPLISTIVAGLVLAYIFGMVANRFRLPPLVGYLFAGILVGPNTPGFVADQALGAELAEIGVILLMFGVGLHFSLKDLMSVKALAIPGAVVQIAFATLLGAGLGQLLGWTLGASLMFGLALSVASTVVLLKALQDRRLVETERGRIAVGWLIVEDLAMVLALVLVPAIASLSGTATAPHDPFVSFVERLVGTELGIWGVVALTVVKVAAFVGFMLIVGRRVIPWALHSTSRTGSRELFSLAVLAIALGVALGSAALFGVSLALGAFFAGMILSESALSHRAAQETLPLREAFSVLFFVSVGMLFDPSILLNNPLPVLATVFIILIGKSIAAFAIVLLFRRPVGTALTISASLAQIGEFSFILASMGVALAIMPPAAQDLILAGALISMMLNPLMFVLAERLRARLEARSGLAANTDTDHRIEPDSALHAGRGPLTADAPSFGSVDTGAAGADDDDEKARTDLIDHTVVVGYGAVGRIVADGLKGLGAPVLVMEDSDKDIAEARADGFESIFGNAASGDVLALANLEKARAVVLAISNGFEAGSVCESVRKAHPALRIIARAYSAEEDAYLRGLGANVIIRGEREIGMGMLAYARGEAFGDEEPVKPEPKLPPSENILEKAAAEPIIVPPIAPANSEPLVPVLEATPAATENALTIYRPADADQDNLEPAHEPLPEVIILGAGESVVESEEAIDITPKDEVGAEDISEDVVSKDSDTAEEDEKSVPRVIPEPRS